MPACNVERVHDPHQVGEGFNAALGNARMQYRPREAAWDGGRMSGFWKPQLFSRKNAEIGKRHVLKNSRKMLGSLAAQGLAVSTGKCGNLPLFRSSGGFLI